MQKNKNKIKNGKILLSSNYTVCGSKKSSFIQDHEASGFVSKLTEINLPILGVLPIERIKV